MKTSKNLTETVIYHHIKEALIRSGKHYHLQRLESNLTAQGIPDVNLCVNNNEVWLELKVYPNKASPMQKSWAKQRLAAGNHNVYLVQGVTEEQCIVSYVIDNYSAKMGRMTYDELVTLFI